MSKLSNILFQKEILLESGTNELEVLVFGVGEYRVGINVAKVREVLTQTKITAVPQTHPSILGCFQLRDKLVPCVSLHKHLNSTCPPQQELATILTEFNQSQIAFQVDHVERIHRISWAKVLPVPASIAAKKVPVTAVALIEGRFVVMLDFETIAQQIQPSKMQQQLVDNPHGVPRNKVRTIIADDSPTVREVLKDTMLANGYNVIATFDNGQAAWDWLQQQLTNSNNAQRPADLLISDVEMPSMDGLHLTKRIKEHANLREIPVVLFSSILTAGNHRKAEAVGADAQITKPELHRIVAVADDVLRAHPALWQTPAARSSNEHVAAV